VPFGQIVLQKFRQRVSVFLPERSDVVNPIVTDEGIIEDLGLRRSRSE